MGPKLSPRPLNFNQGLQNLTGWFSDEWWWARQLGLVLLEVNRRFGWGAWRSRSRRTQDRFVKERLLHCQAFHWIILAKWFNVWGNHFWNHIVLTRWCFFASCITCMYTKVTTKIFNFSIFGHSHKSEQIWSRKS